jgi:lysophospholipid acyltransferase
MNFCAVTFVTGAFAQNLHKSLRRKIRPIFLTERYSALKPAYDFAGWFVTQSVVNYLATSFLLLTLKASLRVWASVYFVWHIAIIFLYIFFSIGSGYLRSHFHVNGKVESVPRVDKIAVPETGIAYTE